MFSLPYLGKLSLAAGTAAVAATLAFSAPASARPFGFHPGFRSGPHFVHGPRFVGGPRFYRGPRFVAGPRYYRGRRYFVGGPVFHGYGCVIHRRWVWGPVLGWHWARVRVCY